MLCTIYYILIWSGKFMKHLQIHIHTEYIDIYSSFQSPISWYIISQWTLWHQIRDLIPGLICWRDSPPITFKVDPDARTVERRSDSRLDLKLTSMLALECNNTETIDDGLCLKCNSSVTMWRSVLQYRPLQCKSYMMHSIWFFLRE